ncbi:hypothetical protein BB561_001554 [Smittium simulii]|uniref:CCHC-type domain-containing protein n=1 Tax=Smittium simulii TaxID=133385 RepID=A0A2T9YU43_9FUNG|nr:hypothetical protein BB561_001554 [Smittium simulii]
MSKNKLESLLNNIKSKIATLDQNIQQAFIDSYDKKKTAIKNELSILQNTLPKHIQPLIEDKDQREGINLNEDIDLYYVPKDMPKFRSGSDSIYDIEEFISCFENCMTMNRLEPKVLRARLIASCLEYFDLQWLQNRVPNFTWIEMILIIIEIFGDPDKESKALNELWTIKPYPNESVTSFSKRFQKIMKNAKIPGSDQGSIKKFIFCLPDPIKWSIEAGIMEKRINIDFINISQYAMRFSNSNSNKVNDTSGNVNLIRKNQISYDLNKKYCTVHKTNSHNTADCNTIKKKSQNNTKPFNTNRKCYKCGNPNHLSNNCTAKKNTVNVIKKVITQKKIKKIYNEVNAIGTKTHNNDFIFPIMICGKEMMTEFDTTADKSCISERLVIELDIPCNNVTGYSIIANSNIKILRNKKTIKVHVKADRTELFTNFEVEDNNAINNETPELVTSLRNPLIEENEPCLDFRTLNKILVDDKYPLPLISNIYKSMGESTIFSTLNLKNAYHRFPIYEKHQYKRHSRGWEYSMFYQSTLWAKNTAFKISKSKFITN